MKGRKGRKPRVGTRTVTKRKADGSSSSYKETSLIRDLSKDYTERAKARAETKKSTAKAKYASRTAGYAGISGVGVADNVSKDERKVQEMEEKKKNTDPTPQITTVTPGPDGTNPIMADDEPEYYYYD